MMRASVYKDDPGYSTFRAAESRGEKILVYLNGVEQRHVRTADTEEGWIEKCKYDADGNHCIDGDEWVHEVLRGNVEIKCVKIAAVTG